jgi:hypothetical protein
MLACVPCVCRLTRPYRGKIELFESDLCGGKGEGRVPDQNPRRHGNGRHESKADMQKRGQAGPDDGDALALTFAQPVGPAEVEEEDEEEEFGRFTGSSNSGWMR